MHHTTRRLAASTLMLALSLPAIAQDAVEEITVTARKREEDLQRTPVSITAYTGADLEARQIRSLSEIGNFTPNLQFDTTSASSGASFISVVYLRGIGQSDFLLTVEPGVGTYVDGVYVARNIGGVLDTLDLERVEVLRGPQGTLFGKNTIGGAISLTSKRPTAEFGGYAEITAGSSDRLDARASVNAPINDKVLTHFAASTKSIDGYVYRPYANDYLGGESSSSARGEVLLLPADDVDVLVTADATLTHEGGVASQLGATNCTGSTLCATYNARVANPLVPASQISNLYVTRDKDLSYGSSPSVSHLQLYGLSATGTWRINDEISLKSITAYRRFSAKFSKDGDNTPNILSATRDSIQDHQVSQEAQLNGSSFDDALKWVAGIYYFGEDGFDNGFNNLTLLRLYNNSRAGTDTIAAFGQATYAITPELSVTVGDRVTRDTRDFQDDAFNTGTGVRLVPAAKVERTFYNQSPKGGIEYQALDNVLVYASISRGFKSGGFNVRVTAPVPAPVSFAPEKLTAYEVGVKYQGLDNRLRVNAALFHSDYENIQVLQRDNIATFVRNAAAATIDGFEIEGQAVPVANLQLGFGAGYLNAGYDTVPPVFPAGAPQDQLRQGDKFQKTPKWTLNASAEYGIPLAGDWGKVTARADWGYKAKVYNDAQNSEAIAQPGYAVTNASIGYEPTDQLYQATFWVKNLFDYRYLINGQSGFYSTGFNELNWARGREFGVTARVRF